MSMPSFHVEDIECPTCHIVDTVRMMSRCSPTSFESVIWCANGHITYLDRHDRATELVDTGDTKNVILIVDLRDKKRN